MKPRPPFIRHSSEFENHEGFSYPGDPAKETFVSYRTMTRDLGFERVAVSVETLAPGKRSSWPHAHLREEEFVYILEGNPHVWIDGETYELRPGDVVGFPPGTGTAHTILNDTDEDVKMLVVGEIDPPGDKIFYPKNPSMNEVKKEKGTYWEGHPEHPLGAHDGKPRPR